jgi:hypothetical protein
MSKTYGGNRSDPMKSRRIPEAGSHHRFRAPFPTISRRIPEAGSHHRFRAPFPTISRRIPEAGSHHRFRTPFPTISRPFLAQDPIFGYDCRIRDGS